MQAQGQKLDGDNLQDVLDAGANSARVGRQQFFTPPEIARALMLPLPHYSHGTARHEAFVDLTMGQGSLLAASKAEHVFGVDIDSRLARKPTPSTLQPFNPSMSWHTVCADLTKLYSLLQEIGWRADLFGLNPPFSVKWHRKNLVGLADSDCAAVAKTFGDRSDSAHRGPTIDSTLATMLIALDRMTLRGEGFLICNNSAAAKLLSLPVGRHVWLHVTISDAQSKHSLFGKNVRPFDVAVLYFARAHTADVPHSVTVQPFNLSTALLEVARKRATLRKGLFLYNQYDACTETFSLWQAAKDEWLRQNRIAPSKTDFNIWLGPDGKIRRHLTPFQNNSARVPSDKAEALNKLQGQSPLALVVQRVTREILLDACGISQPSTINPQPSPWRVDPALVAAVHEAIAAYNSERAPFYQLNKVQRLGYLDEEDSIRCEKDFSPSSNSEFDIRNSKLEPAFRAGESYAFTSETINIERPDVKINLFGDHEDVTYHGKELAFYLTDRKSRRHRFTGVDPEDETKNVKKKSSPADFHHRIEDLLEHFHIPEVPDVSQIDPARFQSFVDHIHRIEDAINQRAA